MLAPMKDKNLLSYVPRMTTQQKFYLTYLFRGKNLWRGSGPPPWRGPPDELPFWSLNTSRQLVKDELACPFVKGNDSYFDIMKGLDKILSEER